MFQRMYGLRDTRVLTGDEDFEDLLADAGAKALNGRRPDLVLYGHTVLAQSMAYRAGFAQRLGERLGAPGVPVLGITKTACTSVLHSIDLASRWLAGPGEAGEHVLVLGGDQGSVSDAIRIIPGVTVAGDGAAAFVVHRGTDRYAYLGGARAKDTRFHRNMAMDPDERRLFGPATERGAVDVVRSAVAAAGLALPDVDWILPHHNNAMFWRGFARTTGFPRERIVLDLLPEYGHVFGIDGLLGLEHLDRTGRLPVGGRAVLVALGQGAYFQAVVIERKE
ncbi:3-oxoacyl-ACP synthase [Streptomyces sp. OfavH-34-F]|uniref:3-oxoacyl-[acyl-carrier-protein] synthase III C-terminal domain-containing protein n=1 Tax=Streptomyces sp. OfavH-34-F TaxID=2917760 RepID=UPI001EF1E997|nr:3-oxoacyl-[acyl-carrier-protein] synthase III C-terminal domain-containing protein [Streptomyces sp. OfavH-34-F]MCG7525529.1 3-oxoacyl-ACP synthase [Streptomyces sp. OfavH-34-F]